MDVLEESDEEGEPRTTGGKKKRTMSYVAKIDQLESLISDIGVMHYPEPYQQNTAKERTMLQYAENFRQQYEYLYPDRKPLLLSPLNECKMQKFVSTTLRPTLLNHKELYTWKGCATFVSDFLIVDSLDLITEVPSYLFASTTILKCQKGNSFDFSTLLCSILLGVGYDAYCVSGYATKEICLMDETKEICPLLQEDDKNKKKEIMPPVKKYTVKPVRELQSKFEINQEARRRAEKILDDEQKQKDYEEMINLKIKGARDVMYGLRVHCWVLVLAGKRDVPENFFIDPFTGNSYETTNERFLGIESIWNHKNYWVNMQDCKFGVKNVRFDLGDPVKWEYMLPSENQEIVVPDSYEYLDEGEDDDEKDVEKIFDMPPSWAQQIVIPAKDIETRCPKGEKIIQYKKANLEKYAPYLNIDGMVKRLIEYEDIECTSFLKVTEWYANRRDNLEKIERNMKTRTITEYFRNGRHLALRKHVFRSSEPETDRTMKFNGKLRVDGLMSRVETPTEMIGKFRDRPDFLIYRHTVFAKRLKKVKLPGASHSNYRTILKIIERFARNRKKPAHQDVAEQIFLITSEHVQLTYHREDDRITAVKREFILPPNLMQKDDQEVNMDQIVMTFEVDPLVKPCKNVVLYQTMIGLLKAQTTSMQAVRDSEHEVREILKDRAAERRANELTISVYDTERNEKAKEHRRTQMRIEEEQRLRRAEEEVDYLAPFLARLGQPKKITKKVAMTLRSDCLADMKQRLIDKANLIQSRFEKEALELQNKQQWYQQNQISMTKEDEQAYLSYCSEAMFRIHILELRLNKHKERAPTRYLALEDKIRKDSRLAKKLKDC
ncbi:dynein regulatory complex subunit 7 isoform X1 [Amblyraja radiata]|uniref:dynein regulatory complex subunit 7 isoform X1 n=1 Tax=Amblyraja radiata TaxID=386614 RepID=UPI001403A888|nr:dynein regulatory complex subunit 7 isoform X1 [Amblyraja radiata]XP_032882559.1 dynein regulatory complex subunit 7 isoform X1 [Amblyraja radiata]